jgi:6-pyruvoyltetrahydropterin/6-carboxytetrahydropterin synthase
MIMTETYSYAHAHHLPTFPADHKCRRVHGHISDVTITIEVENGEKGYAFDHALLDGVARDAIGPLDHQLINEIPGLEDGLAETQLAWIVAGLEIALAPLGATLTRVDLDEWSSGSTLRRVAHRKSWVS